MRLYLAEFVGTFVLVFGGVGSAVLAGTHIGFAGIALAFGLSCWRWCMQSVPSPVAT